MASPSRMRAAVLAGALALVGGCREPTEIVVVVDTDLTQFVDFDVIRFSLSNGFGGGFNDVGTSTTLPATIGFIPTEGGRQVFDIMVAASKNDDFGVRPPPIASRRVSNIPFVSGEMRALFVPLTRHCACEGTSCPNALDDECRDITAPKLTDFDEDDLPRLQVPAP